MTLADLKAEALAQVDQLRRERDEARRWAADLTKILIREGGVEGAYERQLAQAFKERDEARAEASRLDDEAIYQRGLYESARAEVERLERLFQQTHGVHHSWVDARHRVAERQREACAERLHGLLKAKQATAVWVGADEIRATPLVTEGEP